jgi:hypothetical protein
MPGIPSSDPEQVYVRLLDEGTDVWRPTTAVRLADGRFRLLPTDDYDPAIETWEFPPGSMVECEPRGEPPDGILVVVRLASRESDGIKEPDGGDR